MSIRSISQPLPGERVLALSPGSLEAATQVWLRRPHLFPGRALTAAALQQRQAWQAGHIAARGRDVLPGVVEGLEVSLAGGAALDTAAVTVDKGRALCASGEDVVLPAALHARLGALPVVAPAAFFANGSGVNDPSADGSLREREVGAALAELAPAARAALPRLGVLVLRPVALDVAAFDPLDPCDRTPGSLAEHPAAHEDWRLRDGAQLLWYVWPAEWLSPAAPTGQVRSPEQMRSLLAARIFDAEGRLPEGQALPWEAFGAPLALVLLDAAGRVLWWDRASVVRRGGRGRDAHLLAGPGRAQAGTSAREPLRWQARIEQFAEQVAAAGPLSAAQLRQQFNDFLPPVGLLPRDALDTTTRRSDFFPLNFDLDAAPVPLEQLDLAVRASAGLAPLNLGAAESVRLLVPVPLAHWEPRLLIQETVDPEFQATLDRFALARARHLGARQGLRTKAMVLGHALNGQRGELLPFDDDAPLGTESLGPWGPPPAGGGHRSSLRAGLHQHYFERARVAFAAGNDRLFVHAYLDPENPPRTLMLQWHVAGGNWEHRAFWGEDLVPWGVSGQASRLNLGALPAPGQWLRLEVPVAALGLAGASLDGMAFTLVDGRAAFGLAGSLNANATSKWFCNVLPEGAVRLGDEPWELLTHTDLHAPFEPAFDVLSLPATALPPTLGGHHGVPAEGVHGHAVEAVPQPFAVAAGESLFTWVYLDPNQPPKQVLLEWRDTTGLAARASWGAPLVPPATGIATRAMGALPQAGRWVRLAVPAADVGLAGRALNRIAFTLFSGHAAFGASGALAATAEAAERVWFAGESPGGQLRGTWHFLGPADMAAPVPAADEGQVQAQHALYEHPALAALSEAERSQLYTLGVQGLAALLRARADRADDFTDYGFVKVQTDVYRVRQLVLGSTAASRLTVSPALASIAQAETAVASQAQIADFVASLRSSAAKPPTAAVPSALAPPAATALRRSALPAMSDAVATSGFAIGGGDAGLLASPMPSLTPSLTLGNKVLLSDRSTVSRAPLAETSPILFKDSLVTEKVALPLPARDVAAAADIAPIVTPPRTPTPADIANASPVVGQSFVRTTTIAKRLEEPKSKEARDYATATRHDALRALQQYALELTAQDGGITPGLFDGLQLNGLEGDGFLDDLPTPPQGQPRLLRRPFLDFVRSPALLGKLMTVPTRVIGQSTDPDEAAFFSDSTDLSDHVVALMRQLEGRIRLYREAVAACERVQQQLQGSLQALQARQRAIGEELAEARHDVAVARALLDEEAERIATLNARRRRVLAEEVKFLAYVRPREADTLLSGPRHAPTHAVDPGLLPAPVPACLREHPEVPDELDDMLRVVREAPAHWFVGAPPLLRRFDRIDDLVRVLDVSRSRSLAAAAPALRAATAAPATRLGQAVAQLQARQVAVAAPRLQALQTLNLAAVQALNWDALRAQAEPVVSFADLAEGGHGRADVARAAAAELENIRRIAACLHAEFSAVLPSIRLDWAEALSQFDDAPSLRNLASLARFNEIAFADRRQLQGYVDFLFGQVEPNQPQAVALVNDVVRMCLLLASHAPVGRIVAGRLARPVTGVRPGLQVPLAVAEPQRIRVGMQAVLMRADRVVARAVVENLATGEASARVVHTEGSAALDLGTDVQVHFSHEAVVSLQPAAARRTRFGVK